MNQNPLARALADWLPDCDFGVMRHGFAPHGRDYSFVVDDGRAHGATYELTFTHVVQLKYETRLDEKAWPTAWDDVMLDYAAWEAAGYPEGHLWGTNWSLAYPGVKAPNSDVDAEAWSTRLGRPMFAASIETNRFFIALIFHEVRSRELLDGAADSEAWRRPEQSA